MKGHERMALAMAGWLGLGLGLVSGASALSADEKPAGVEAKAAFERIKALDGEWKVSGSEHGHDGKIIYKVMAKGSAVMSSEFPGTEHEMVTMYHLDGDELLATHYCAAGNQPRLKLDRKGSTPDTLSFVFDGGTNLDPAKDMHIHGFRVKFAGSGKVDEEWDAYMGGKKAGTTEITLTRP